MIGTAGRMVIGRWRAFGLRMIAVAAACGALIGSDAGSLRSEFMSRIPPAVADVADAAVTDVVELRGTVDLLLRALDDSRAAGDQWRLERDRLLRKLVKVEQRVQRLSSLSHTGTRSWRALEGGAGAAEAVPAAPGRTALEYDRLASLDQTLNELEEHFLALYSSRRRIVERVQSGALFHIGALERAIEHTGLDVDTLLSAEMHAVSGQGGPFIADAARPTDNAAVTDVAYVRLDARLRHWEALQALIQQMPLVPPLDEYTINSPFGHRRDPINRRRAVHEGLDLDAPRKSPVFAPAPGTVVFAGRNGRYGHFVEIDHGFGLTTAYAHLDAIAVERGQVVRLGDGIGLLGNSGRSTGAHLHYEVRYRDRAMDPMAFIRAGRIVFEDQRAAGAVSEGFGVPARRPLIMP